MELPDGSATRRAGALGVHSLHRFVFTVPDLDVGVSARDHEPLVVA